MMHHAAILRASEDTNRWDLVVERLHPGAHLVLIGDTPNWEAQSIQARKAGLSLRDAFALASPTGIRFYPLFRKDLTQGTVAAQVRDTGTGAFNIDVSRIYTDWNEPDRPDSWKTSGFTKKPEAVKIAAPPGQGINCHPKGRWPSNVGFQHRSECVQEGVKRVQGTSIPQGTKLTATRRSGAHAAAGGHQTIGRVQPVSGHSEADGKETIANWKCAAGCPVRQLDEQSGLLKSGVGAVRRLPFAGYSGGGGQVGSEQLSYGDEGGASRFYKQFRSEEELLSYLRGLLLPANGLLLTEFPQ